MKGILLLAALLLQLFPALATDEGSLLFEDRKIWSRCDTNDDGILTCRCGDGLHRAVQCSDDGTSLQIQPCYCLYYETSENRTIAGNCMTTCYRDKQHYSQSITRYSVEDGHQFNIEMCSSLLNMVDTNREGRFCGRCKDGYGLAVYSYHYTICIPCQHYSYMNWLRYLAVAFLPLTAFYVAVVLLKINVCSSRLSGILFAIQCLMSPEQLRVFDGWVYAAQQGDPNIFYHCLSFIAGVIGIVNLDFLRTFYPYFCLHPKLNILHVVSLDFAVALYPFFLILVTYLLVTLYDRGYRLVVWAWRPVKWCLGRSLSNKKGSLIETFATFILLSSVKILVVCFDLLFPTRAYTETRLSLNTRFLYYDANIEYFGSQHLPFALLALIIGFVFVLLPFFLLLVYPCRCFQKFLGCFGFGFHSLRTFMDAFQGGYKLTPRDLRFFSAYYLLLRFVILFTTGCIASVFSFTSSAFLVIVGGIIFAAFQPYKNDHHNRFDLLILLSMALLYTSLSSNIIAGILDQYWITLSSIIIGVSITILVIVTLVPAISLSLSKVKFVFVKLQSVLCAKKMQREDSSTSLLISRDEGGRSLAGIAES
jgi:hypothetical protein